jgi:hypothetical protein
MSVSKYGKTYYESGSEQAFDGTNEPRPGAQRGAEIGRERWEDDGGLVNTPPSPPTARPAWSVLSSRDLGEAIRREQQADDSSRVRLAVERREASRRRLAADAAANVAYALKNHYRNAWENT